MLIFEEQLCMANLHLIFDTGQAVINSMARFLPIKQNQSKTDRVKKASLMLMIKL